MLSRPTVGGASSVLTVWGKLCRSIRCKTREDRNCGTFYFYISRAGEALVRGLKESVAVDPAVSTSTHRAADLLLIDTKDADVRPGQA